MGKSIIVAKWTNGLSNLLRLTFKKLCSQLGKQSDSLSPKTSKWPGLPWRIIADNANGKKHPWEWWVVFQRTWLALNFLQQVWDENEDWTTPSGGHRSVSPRSTYICVLCKRGHYANRSDHASRDLGCMCRWSLWSLPQYEKSEQEGGSMSYAVHSFVIDDKSQINFFMMLLCPGSSLAWV